MFKFTSPTSIGLERTFSAIKMASLAIVRNKPIIKYLLSVVPDQVISNITDQAIITTGIESKHVLIRPLNLPLTKTQDIEAALNFQAEPFLPYPVENAILTYQIRSKSSDATNLTLLSIRQETFKTHVEEWQKIGIEPERVSCIPEALCAFGNIYLLPVKNKLIFQVDRQNITCVLVANGNVLASFTEQIGLDVLLQDTSMQSKEWSAVDPTADLTLYNSLIILQRTIAKMGLSLIKELRNESVEGLAITGEAATWKGLPEQLVRMIDLPFITCIPERDFSADDLLSYAIPIGLALGALGSKKSVDFRHGPFAYPFRWKRLKLTMALYFVLIVLLSTAFYFFGQQYLSYREEHLKLTYIDLLNTLNKSHEQFESSFILKNKLHSSVANVMDLTENEITERLVFVQKTLREMPDTVPLFPNIPLVGDLLTWLTIHPAVAYQDENGNPASRITIDSLSYMIVKRPLQGKKLEKYQVKVELEFSSPTPKWAREFHDALIAPNDWVDPKGEVKWNSNQGKYKTSFYLKDKTTYHT